METHATTKKSLTSRIGNLFKGKKKVDLVPPPEHLPPTQSPAPNVVSSNVELSDAEVEARINDAFDNAPKQKATEDHVHTASCKHSHKAKPGKKSLKMRDLYPGYEGPKFTPSSPSPATLKQKLQKKARRLRRQTEK